MILETSELRKDPKDRRSGNELKPEQIQEIRKQLNIDELNKVPGFEI